MPNDPTETGDPELRRLIDNLLEAQRRLDAVNLRPATEPLDPNKDVIPEVVTREGCEAIRVAHNAVDEANRELREYRSTGRKRAPDPSSPARPKGAPVEEV
jgi:hypothetical protein